MTEDDTIDQGEFEIIDRNGDTIAVSSVDALDEEFGPDETFADKVKDLSDHDLHIAVEELMRRAFQAARRQLEFVEDASRMPLYIAIAGQSSVDRLDHDAIKYNFKVYDYTGPDAQAETFDLVLSANTAARRYGENKQNQPRKLLAAS